MAWIDPLDLETIFVDKFAGSATVFIFIAFLVIALLAARFKMPGGALAFVLVLFTMLFFSTFLVGISQALMIVVFVGIAYMIAKAFGRGFN